jgi:hypothetical protein
MINLKFFHPVLDMICSFTTVNDWMTMHLRVNLDIGVDGIHSHALESEVRTF